jgi:hypothetical protein
MLANFSQEINLGKEGSANQDSFLSQTFKFVFFRHPFERLVIIYEKNFCTLD